MPVLMPWVDEVTAIIQVWPPGQALGEALADVLLGQVEPGGRLPVTIPRPEVDSPVLHAHPNSGELAYTEGLLIGYRGYDRALLEPLFCFGHGLGFTDWVYESLRVAADDLVAGEDLELCVTLRNAAGRQGREVVQVYLQEPIDDPRRPLRVLAAFAPVRARPGEIVEAQLRIPARAFARFSDAAHRWEWPAEIYTLHVGRSSRDLRLSAQVTVG